jgi:hypothetical protein
MNKYKNARPRLDDRNTIHLPLDYSFKTLSGFSGEGMGALGSAELQCTIVVDVLKERQRSRGEKQTMVRLHDNHLLCMLYNSPHSIVGKARGHALSLLLGA